MQSGPVHCSMTKKGFKLNGEWNAVVMEQKCSSTLRKIKRLRNVFLDSGILEIKLQKEKRILLSFIVFDAIHLGFLVCLAR